MKSDHNGLDVELRDLVEGTEGQDKGGHWQLVLLMAKSRPLLSFQVREYFQLTDTVWASVYVCVCGVSPVWHTLSHTLVILLILAIYTFYNPSFELLSSFPLSCPFREFCPWAIFAHPLREKRSNSSFQLSICAGDSGGIDPSEITLYTLCLGGFNWQADLALGLAYLITLIRLQAMWFTPMD